MTSLQMIQEMCLFTNNWPLQNMREESFETGQGRRQPLERGSQSIQTDYDLVVSFQALVRSVTLPLCSSLTKSCTPLCKEIK